MSDPREDFKIKVIRNESVAAQTAARFAAAVTEIKAREDDLTRLRLISDNESARQFIPLDATIEANRRLDVEYDALVRIEMETFGKSGTVVNLATVGPTGVYAISHIQFPCEPDISSEVQNVFRVYDTRQQAAFATQPVVDGVRHKLSELDCVRPMGSNGLTNIEQLEDAWQKFRNPSNGRNDVLGSLLGMRQCIDGVLDSLKQKLRNRNVKGGKASCKVRAILAELAAEQLGPQLIEQIAVDADDIHTQLSKEGKPSSLDRVTTHARLQRASEFLRDLLNRIDASKCRG
jgi:hypothetical protein